MAFQFAQHLSRWSCSYNSCMGGVVWRIQTVLDVSWLKTCQYEPQSCIQIFTKELTFIFLTGLQPWRYSEITKNLRNFLQKEGQEKTLELNTGQALWDYSAFWVTIPKKRDRKTRQRVQICLKQKQRQNSFLMLWMKNDSIPGGQDNRVKKSYSKEYVGKKREILGSLGA